MLQYLSPLPFEVQPRDLEFLQKGQIEKSSFWLWAFFADDGRRWNLCVVSGPDPFDGTKMMTWMRANNNAYNLSDRDYIAALLSGED